MRRRRKHRRQRSSTDDELVDPMWRNLEDNRPRPSDMHKEATDDELVDDMWVNLAANNPSIGTSPMPVCLVGNQLKGILVGASWTRMPQGGSDVKAGQMAKEQANRSAGAMSRRKSTSLSLSIPRRMKLMCRERWKSIAKAMNPRMMKELDGYRAS